MTEADIVLDQVNKQYGPVMAVNDASVAVQRGEFLSIIGPSGCGKSVVLRLIAGLESPTSGEIYIKGVNVKGVPPYQRNVGMVFQNFALWPHTNVHGNVEFGLKMRGVSKSESKSRVAKALKDVGLEGYGERRISELSGGQKQRVGLARSLVLEPSVLLLDEPLGSLDAKLRIEMQSELKQLQREMGITFIHLTGEQSEALAMADRIVVMAKGRFEQIGTPSEIYVRPRTRFVAGFVGKNNIFEGEVEASEGADLRVRTTDGVFTLRGAAETAPQGKEVTFVVRAELLRQVGEGGDGLDNKVVGTVQGLEYTGSIVTLILALPSGQELKMEQHESLTRHLAPRHGDKLNIGWKAQDTYILPS
ncbi:MAG: ABC transporter ATP-binding protein [Chloroflexi bacterium]|nr:ABC transporter ATP-binding protein [Chloroflexota bacterium]